jgi:hypothetical protein
MVKKRQSLGATEHQNHGISETENLTLCAPDPDRTCFACCPPIRPAGYEHIQHKSILKREFRENTLSFKKDDRRLAPITGFNCWALGYLDKSYRRIGCLLHPFQNGGTDLRFRVDYGEKCRRESCPESLSFSRLKDDVKGFWLHLTDGLDSFDYSSRKENPLFTIMAWGTHLLNLIPRVEGYRMYEREVFLEEFPFFRPAGTPRGHAYPARRLIDEDNVHLLKKPAFGVAFLRFSCSLSLFLTKALGGVSGGTAVHRLSLDRDFLDFLRLSAKIMKVSEEDALRLKALADEELDRFRRSL